MPDVHIYEVFDGSTVSANINVANLEELRVHLRRRISDDLLFALEESSRGESRLERKSTTASLTNADFHWLTTAAEGARRCIRIETGVIPAPAAEPPPQASG